MGLGHVLASVPGASWRVRKAFYRAVRFPFTFRLAPRAADFILGRGERLSGGVEGGPARPSGFGGTNLFPAALIETNSSPILSLNPCPVAHPPPVAYVRLLRKLKPK
jgi:hypothetical protein